VHGDDMQVTSSKSIITTTVSELEIVILVACGRNASSTMISVLHVAHNG